MDILGVMIQYTSGGNEKGFRSGRIRTLHLFTFTVCRACKLWAGSSVRYSALFSVAMQPSPQSTDSLIGRCLCVTKNENPSVPLSTRKE